MIYTIHGPLRYDRAMLIPKNAESKEALLRNAHVKSIFPLDDALGISRLPFKMTPALMLRCAYWAQNQCSYQAAENVIRDTYGMEINDDTIRQVTNCIGRAVFEEDCRKTDSLFQKQEGGKLDFKNNRKGILYIEADGAALNTRHRNEEGSTWRENKLGVVYSSDHIYYWKDKKGERQHHIEKRSMFPTLGRPANLADICTGARSRTVTAAIRKQCSSATGRHGLRIWQQNCFPTPSTFLTCTT